MSLSTRTSTAVAIVVAGVAGVAVAAQPESGKVDASNPRVEWKGSVTASWAQRVPMAASDENTPCNAPHCDKFRLAVADGPATLTIGATAPDDDDQVTIRVHKPDGTRVKINGAAGPQKPLLLKINSAANGNYVVDYANYYVDGPVEYMGSAQLGVAGGPAQPTRGTEPGVAQPGAGGGSGQSSPQPGGAQPAQDFTLTAKARKIKGRSLTVAVKTSRPVEKLVGQVKKGKKVLGKGTRMKFPGSGTLKVKLRKKLKAGRYSLFVAATDSRGVTVSRTIALKVKKPKRKR